MKTKLAIAGAAVVALTLTGCGNESAAYCEELESAQTQFESLSGSDPSQLEEAFNTIHDLADEAPEEVAEEWAQIDEAIVEIEQAFEAAGLEVSELEQLQGGEIPEGVDAEALQEIPATLQAFGTQFSEASEPIQEHAASECDIELGS